ncbi:hypothetical protein ES706_04622 [subsurface metagenome]
MVTTVEQTERMDLRKIKCLQEDYGFQVVMDDQHTQRLLNQILLLEEPTRKRLLGQIYTPDWIANYIAALCIKEPTDKGIEPCFGKGIFITTMAKRLLALKRSDREHITEQITGVEADPLSFIEGLRAYKRLFEGNPGFHNLYLGNFFDFHEGKDTYDFAMMNPPYVRQERLSSSSMPEVLRKDSLLQALKTHVPSEYLSKKANLYFYFFLHLSNFIKEGGRIAAITYNSWLYTRSGRLLQRFFLDNFRIKYIIDFDREAFQDALIGSCIVLLEKATTSSDKSVRDDNVVEFVRLKNRAPLSDLINATESKAQNGGFVNRHMIRQAHLYTDDKWEKYFYLPSFHEELVNNPKLMPLKSLAQVFRGFVPLSTRFFILDSKDIDRFKIAGRYLIPVLKDPKTVKGMTISNLTNGTFFLHATERKSELQKHPDADGLLEYLSYIESEILKKPNKFKSMTNSIQADNEGWYIQKLNRAGHIIFSYVIRRNKQFYLNGSELVTTDNFHNIISKIDKHSMLAVLNSSLTKYLLETCGRTQGSGLLKVQVYELADLLVPDLSVAPVNYIQRFSEAGARLAELDGRLEDVKVRRQIIREIDKLVFEFLEADKLLEPLIQAEADIMASRLSRRREGK